MEMTEKSKWILTAFFMLISTVSQAKQIVEIFAINNSSENQGIGQFLGTVEFMDSEEGLVIKPKLKGLTPGEHGFHIHEHPNCGASKINNQ